MCLCICVSMCVYAHISYTRLWSGLACTFIVIDVSDIHNSKRSVHFDLLPFTVACIP